MLHCVCLCASQFESTGSTYTQRSAAGVSTRRTFFIIINLLLAEGYFHFVHYLRYGNQTHNHSNITGTKKKEECVFLVVFPVIHSVFYRLYTVRDLHTDLMRVFPRGGT